MDGVVLRLPEVLAVVDPRPGVADLVEVVVGLPAVGEDPGARPHPPHDHLLQGLPVPLLHDLEEALVALPRGGGAGKSMEEIEQERWRNRNRGEEIDVERWRV